MSKTCFDKSIIPCFDYKPIIQMLDKVSIQDKSRVYLRLMHECPKLIVLDNGKISMEE